MRKARRPLIVFMLSRLRSHYGWQGDIPESMTITVEYDGDDLTAATDNDQISLALNKLHGELLYWAWVGRDALTVFQHLRKKYKA